MAVIRCPACGKPNPDFLEVCQYCDAPLQAGAAPSAATPAPSQEPAASSQGTIRCQSCGKSNPDFLDVCQYCEARLKPLLAGAPADDDLPSTASAADTLSRLRAAAAPVDEEPEPEPEATAEPAPADWMSRLQGEAASSPAPTQDEPDWLWGGVGKTEDEEVKTEDGGRKTDEPDWLSSLRGSAAPAQPEETPAPAPAEDVPDWLRSMGSAEAAPPPVTSPAAPAEDVPDWLRSMGSAEAAPPPVTSPAAPAEDVPDWLRSMGSTEAAPPPVTSPAAPAEDVPDWLRSMGSAEATPQPEALPVASAPADDAPDWLRSMSSAAEAAPEPAQPAAAPSTPFDDAPDWLRSMGGSEPAPESAPSATPAATPFEDMPDWLRSMSSAEPEPAEPAAPAFAPAPTQAEPEFLWGAPASAETAEPEAPAAAASEEMPDWLRSLGGASASPAETIPQGAPAAAKVSPFALPSGDMPDWLQAMAPEAGAALPAAGPLQEAGSSTPAASTEAPDWLSGLRSSAAETSAPTGNELAPGDELPSWLGSVAAGAAVMPESVAPSEIPEAPQPKSGGSIFGAPTTPAKGNLAQATLPSWLTAMRPVDVGRPVVQPEMDDYAETVGFLAGVPGILRAEPTVALPHKSAVNVHKLEVSPADVERAALFTNLLNADTEARPASKRGLQIALPFERWFIFSLVALAVILPAFFLPGFFPPPTTIGLETQAAYLKLDGLSADKPVLVAFDYEPAQAGELNPVAEALLTHLMRRGVPVVGVSTRLGGAAVGDDLLKQLSVPYTYTYGINYTNLGYIPGGPVGLLQFAIEPRSLFQADFSGDSDVWKSKVVSQVKSVSDFGLILIIAATPDSARAWIEQMHQSASSVQMVAAVSAGAEPLVRPYYEADPPQLQGLVSGVLAAAQYERQAGVPGAASERWGALGGGLLAVALLLIVGNLIHGLIGFLRRRRAA